MYFIMVGLVASRCNNCTLPTRKSVIRQPVKDTPNPPIHCVILRQNKSPCGNDSILSKILAPVVVNPDMVSKKASVLVGNISA